MHRREARQDRRSHDPVPTFWRTLRTSALAFSDAFGSFVAANVLWFLAALAIVLASQLTVFASALLLLLIPVTAGLGRMAAVTGRGRPGRFAHFRTGVRHRAMASLLLGSGQVATAGIALINLSISLEAEPTLIMAVSGATSGWVLVMVAASALALWPLLLDPERDDLPVRTVVRTGFAVALARPGRLLLLIMTESVLVGIALQTVIGAMILTSFGVLLAAHTVLPIADAIEGRTVDGSADDL